MDLMDYRRKIIANSPHLMSASGAVVSFSDGADLPLKSLLVDIEPVQSGTGDPSPTNIKPISGWSAVNVTRTGKNLVAPFVDGTSTSKGISITYANNLITFVGTSTGTNASSPNKYFYHNGESSPLLLKAGVTYTASLYGRVSFTNKLRLIFTYESSTRLYYDSYDGVWTFTPDADVIITQACLRLPTTGSTADISAYFQLEEGSTATPYEPYNGVNVSIDLGQTVYGGTLNPLTGVLTAYPYYASYNGETLTGRWVSDRDKYVAGTTPTIGAQVVDMSGTGTEIQLTPHQIRSLYGNNTIFADTGNVALEYWAHP